MKQTPIKISLRWTLLNFAGALMCAGGVYLLQQAQVPGWIGTLLLVCGLPLMVWALLQLLLRSRPGTSADTTK